MTAIEMIIEELLNNSGANLQDKMLQEIKKNDGLNASPLKKLNFTL